MTNKTLTRSNWGGGANNRNTSDRLPEGFYRHSVNLDPVGGGKLQLRAGYSQALAGDNIRGALALGTKILLADGADLIEFDTRTSSSRALRTITAAGDFAGCVYNNELYFCTANESLRYDGNAARPWGVLTMPAQPAADVEVGGGLIAGTYAFAATFVDADGLEGGTGPSQAFLCADGSRVAFTMPQPPSGGRVRLYVGRSNSTTLYLQHEQSAAGDVVISGLRDDIATLDTQHHVAPPQGQLIAAWNGRLLIASGSVLWMTEPMRPHLVRRAHGFFQYPSRITVMAPVVGGVFVVADKTYFLSGEGQDVQQRVIDSARAVAGSQAELPDQRVVWMTEYGQVIGNPDGSLKFLTKDHYIPDNASQGCSGLLEHNGNQLLVTTQRGIPSRGGLGMGDFVTGMEILAP